MTATALWMYRFMVVFWIIFSIALEIERPISQINFMFGCGYALIGVLVIFHDLRMHRSNAMRTSSPEIQQHLRNGAFISYTLYTLAITIWITHR